MVLKVSLFTLSFLISSTAFAGGENSKGSGYCDAYEYGCIPNKGLIKDGFYWNMQNADSVSSGECTVNKLGTEDARPVEAKIVYCKYCKQSYCIAKWPKGSGDKTQKLPQPMPTNSQPTNTAPETDGN